MSSSDPESCSSTEDKTNNWSSKSSRMVLYDPVSDALKTDWLTEDDSNFSLSFYLLKLTNFLENSSVKVQLPRWRNSVDIYIDDVFVATIKLDRLGTKVNWQRRFRHKHPFLYMKDLEPKEEGRPSILARL